MRGFDHATILGPNFHGLRKEGLAQWPAFCVPKIPGGILPEKLGGGLRHASWNPYPISDQNLWFSLPYFRPDQNLIPYSRPEALEPGAWPERVTSCYGTYTVVGVNIKTEMVLLPNDEEVANSSKKNIPNSRLECTSHTLFQAIILYYYMRNFCNLIGWEQWYFSLIKHCFVTQNLGSAKCLKTIMI